MGTQTQTEVLVLAGSQVAENLAEQQVTIIEKPIQPELLKTQIERVFIEKKSKDQTAKLVSKIKSQDQELAKHDDAKLSCIQSVLNAIESPTIGVEETLRSILMDERIPVLLKSNLYPLLRYTKQLSKGLDNLMLLEKIESNCVSPNLVPVNIVSIIDAIEGGMTLFLEDKDITLVVDNQYRPNMLNTDPQLFDQICNNSLDCLMSQVKAGDILEWSLKGFGASLEMVFLLNRENQHDKGYSDIAPTEFGPSELAVLVNRGIVSVLGGTITIQTTCAQVMIKVKLPNT